MGGSAGQPGLQAGRKRKIKIKILQNGGIRRPAGPASGMEAQLGSSREQGLERLAWIDRGTCAPLPFHITGGQPAVGIVVQCPRPRRLSLDKDDVGNL
ncbi:unnamed protein product [Spirodela intermedia]|uniref:Uncharacterized protein n=1 Tax=Spirodela intermedia TaxID=51605 RepID=A0A7I8KXV1_SPIIN|nr:unnamed protein product [Spirodela intermedia]